MELTTILSMLLIAAFLTVLLRRYRPELAMGVGIVAGAIALLAVLKTATPAVSQLQALLDGAALPQAPFDAADGGCLPRCGGKRPRRQGGAGGKAAFARFVAAAV